MDATESPAALPARIHRVLQRNIDVRRVAGRPATSFAIHRCTDAGRHLEARVDEMGFPGGLPRTITVDLTGKLPPQARRIRITTNLQIYWDQVLVDNGPEQPNPIRITEAPLASATLAFRGYPRQVDGATPGDLTYYYDQASTTGPFSQFRGSYTRYGDVTSLLTQIDDRFAIFGTGEDIDAEFSAAPLPPLPPGWTRDYFFYANGFVKDMDFYEATPFTVA